MSLKEAIEEQYRIKTAHAEPDNAVDLAESLESLSRDLYTDTTRFIYELLQNADDAGSPENKVRIGIRFFGNTLVVAHSGKPFDDRDVRGLCAINNGAKKKDEGKTGFKGIGFKSVFARSGHVTVYSGGEFFRFDSSNEFEWLWADKWTKGAWEQAYDREFKFPWQIIPIYTPVEQINAEIRTYLNEEGFSVATLIVLNELTQIKNSVETLTNKPEMFLFLKNVEELKFLLAAPKAIKFAPTEETEEYKLLINNEIHSRWLKHTVELTIPEYVSQALQSENHVNIPDKVKQATVTELTLAARIGENGLEKLEASSNAVYSYLPTEEYDHPLPVLINAGFLLSSSREKVHRNVTWNEWLFGSIATEIFTWIAELVKSSWQYQAYAILPSKFELTDKLSSAFNSKMEDVLNNIPFVINNRGELLRSQEAIVDFTFLSEKTFVGETVVRAYCEAKKGMPLASEPFVPNTGHGTRLHSLGVFGFNWKHIPELLASPALQTVHNTTSNQQFIAFIYKQVKSEKPKITQSNVKEWSFIYNHKNQLSAPNALYFPNSEDQNWNQPNSESDYVHPEIQTWLNTQPQIKQWFVELGIEEKTDLTFVKHTIAPNAANYCTKANAVETIQQLFSLFQRGELPDLWDQLKHLKLLTKNGTLITATECYFSNDYQPRLPLEEVLQQDIFLHPDYLTDGVPIKKWRHFFDQLGVKEGIELVPFTERLYRQRLESKNLFDPTFFETDKRFFNNYFLADEYQDIETFFLLQYANTSEFARCFWDDVVRNITEELKPMARAFWGYVGRAGKTNGDPVENYLQWYIKTHPCIPVTTGDCLPATQVFQNSEDLTKLLGSYLPVFDGPELSSDWRAFFQFKTELSLQDFLTLLTEIANDRNEAGKLKQGNWKRVSAIYDSLLTACENWGEQDRHTIRDWAATAELAAEGNTLVQASELKFYADGSSSIFQGSYQFIRWEHRHRQHPQSTALLELFGVESMYQNQFQIDSSDQRPGTSLYNALKQILSYWAKSRETEVQGGYEQMHYELSYSLEQLQVFEVSELSVRYGEHFEKRVYAHLNGSELYVQKDWQKELVMLNLTDLLCRYFNAKGQERQLAFFLRADPDEIHDWFGNQDIDLPPSNPEEVSNSDNTSEGDNAQPKVEKTPIDYSAYWAQSKERNAEWMEGLEGSPADLLVAGLKRQSSHHQGFIYHFSHIENAVKILNENSIKSRSLADFKDSASQGIISQTDEAKKQFARFYFRPHTPTQFYVENLGQGSKTIESLGEETVCPVPVFFKIPIEQIFTKVDQWRVSLGSMAAPSMKHGADFETIEQFDFDGVYLTKEDLGYERYKVAAHQEFLIPEQLLLEGLDVELVVQNEWSEATLKTLLNSSDWNEKIKVDKELFLNQNPQLQIEIREHHFSAMVPTGRTGQLILQVHDAPSWLRVSGIELTTFQTESTHTYISFQGVQMEVLDLDQLKFTLHFSYNGQVWQYYAQNRQEQCDDQFIGKALQKAFDTQPNAIGDYLNTVAVHPLINYWFEKPIGGPDRLNLKTHTHAVLANYLEYFNGRQSLFSNEAVFLLFLALHDIGKPRAVLLESKTKQHEYSISMIDELASYLPASKGEIEQIKNLLNGDPIGHYLNPFYSNTLEETQAVIEEMASKLQVSSKELWPTLIIYYQCDAAGYDSLREKLFEQDTLGVLVMHDNLHRLKMQPEQEAKLIELENHYAN